ncbi:hypothetical protein, partial [Paenibacillus senegalensis]|uniref:hypothetical protein n=1 Tax=Paenibacillus senegalensis TaxID=1465766 RepID=UPI001B310D79
EAYSSTFGGAPNTGCPVLKAIYPKERLAHINQRFAHGLLDRCTGFITHSLFSFQRAVKATSLILTQPMIYSSFISERPLYINIGNRKMSSI